jgi:hypothetical protein
MLPEPAAAVGISKQIKSSGRACGVFRVAKMFLERPERYRVRVDGAGGGQDALPDRRWSGDF